MATSASIAGRVRHIMVDAPDSVGARKRAARWALAMDSFPDLEQCSVLDLGGTTDAWLRAPVRPKHVTLINLFEPGETDESWLTPVTGDACRARETLEAAGLPTTYDVVFSNSLLEHVGGHAQREAMAREVHALAPRHWVQTPNRYFPVEPHWLFPGMQFLPTPARARVAAYWPLGHTPPHDLDEGMSSVQWTELVGPSELRTYFPNSRIHKERLAGMTKSLVAIADQRP